MHEYDPQKIEREVLDFWKREKIVQRALELRKGRKKFKFLEGPPTMNAPAHIGHGQGRIIKDVILRLKTMQGFWVRRQAGWDCQGLPIEIATEKKLGIKSKKDVERLGIDKFVRAARQLVLENIKKWERDDWRLGVWFDWAKAYKTMDDDYIEFTWWTFKKANELGLVVKELNVIPTCPRCETALAQHEVDQGYAERSDWSIFVKFPTKVMGEFLIIWTTTPWTLPANVAVAANPKFKYAKVKVKDEIWLIAYALVDKVLAELGIKEYKILETLPGERLLGIKYIHPLLKEVQKHKEFGGDYLHSLILADFVTLEEGTGLVHIAPGHGPEDFEVGKKYSLPIFCPVGQDGRFTEEADKYRGKYVFDANEEVIEDLQIKGLLLKAAKITHSYPHCWRCDTPLVYISSSQWFIKTGGLKKKLIQESDKVKWFPAYVGTARFRDWLENLRDWCASRQKFWGTPLPIWECESCGNFLVIGSKGELLANAKEPRDLPELHRPWVDSVILVCPNCQADMHRISDVGDIWFDSGVAPGASLGYMQNPALFKQWFPADFITEAIDQTRGWYYSLLFCNVLAFGQAPYRTVLNQGHVLDEHGRKMSKRLGNVISLAEGMDRFGADPLRFYMLWKAPVWENKNFDPTELNMIRGQFFNALWNTYRFYEIYFAAAGLEKVTLKSAQKEDKWIISRINSLLDFVNKKFKNYELHEVTRVIYDFVLLDLSRWYVKLIRNRTWPTYDGEDKEAAFAAMLYVMRKLIKLFAPICPFITEHMYQKILKEKEGSIHLSDWPEPERKRINKDLEKKMEIVMRIAEAANAIRQEYGVGLRYPVKRIVISGTKDTVEAAKDLELIIKRIINVKLVEIGEIAPKVEIKLNYAIAGPKFGPGIKRIENALAKVDHARLAEDIKRGRKALLAGEKLTKGDILIRERMPSGIAGKEFAGGFVYLDLAETPDLFTERVVRELARCVQKLRKQKGLQVHEEIMLGIKTDKKTEEMIRGWEKKLMPMIGAKEVRYKIKRVESSCAYKDKKISVEIERVKD